MNTARRAIPVSAATVAAAAVLWSAAAGCTPTVKVKHEVEPIHLTADINIRVDRQLDQFFAYQDQPTNGATTQPKTTAPATQTVAGDVK